MEPKWKGLQLSSMQPQEVFVEKEAAGEEPSEGGTKTRKALVSA